MSSYVYYDSSGRVHRVCHSEEHSDEESRAVVYPGRVALSKLRRPTSRPLWILPFVQNDTEWSVLPAELRRFPQGYFQRFEQSVPRRLLAREKARLLQPTVDKPLVDESLPPDAVARRRHRLKVFGDPREDVARNESRRRAQ